MTTSRRDFLWQGALGASALTRWPHRVRWTETPGTLAPEPDAELFQALALAAVDAARTAGATFADVRVSGSRYVAFWSSYQKGGKPTMQPPGVSIWAGFGVRALVGGAWGFASGYDLTREGAARAARSAVARARVQPPRHRMGLDLAPTPVVPNGRWTTPIERNPFDVPVGEQADLALAAVAAAMAIDDVRSAQIFLAWRQVEEIFASSDGSLIVQRRHEAEPVGSVSARTGDDYTNAYGVIRGIRRGGYGYEAVTGTDLGAGVRAAAEVAIRESRVSVPPKEMEVGRYDTVFAAPATAHMLANTLGYATDLERALGYAANGMGTSFAGPPDKVLGSYQIAAPTLTVRGNRSAAHAWATIGWDAEGVAPDDYTIVDRGVLVDYHTSRETAPALADWYRRRGQPMRAHGCVRGNQDVPAIQLPNLSIEPGKDAATADDLIADTRRGIHVSVCSPDAGDQQLLNFQGSVDYRNVREIRNGKLGPRLSNAALQFIAPTFWKNVETLGGPGSVVPAGVSRTIYARGPMEATQSTIHSVPMRVRQVNWLNVGRTA